MTVELNIQLQRDEFFLDAYLSAPAGVTNVMCWRKLRKLWFGG